MIIMNDKKYILHYPSRFGMGSNTDIMLISDEDVRYIIRTEVERKLNGKSRFCERFTGTWNGEKFCDSADMTEIEEDVISKRLNARSTYAEVNDLVELPDEKTLASGPTKMQDAIFHIWSEHRDCYTDIIAGEAVFTRYFLDLSGEDDFAGLVGGKIHEFVCFDMKRVLCNSYVMNDIDSVLKMEETRCKRFESKLNGTYNASEEKYIDDIIPQDDEELYRRYKKEWEEVAAKFAVPITCEDKYLKRYYTAYPNRHLHEALLCDMMEISKSDHRKYAYEYPRYLHSLGAVFSDKKDDNVYFRYDELFKCGCDIKYLPAVKINDYAFVDEIKGIEAFFALRNVFGIF